MDSPINRLLDRYLPHNPSGGWYRSPDIPEKKLNNALARYAGAAGGENVLALADGTIWGSAKEGVVLTDRACYCHTIDGEFTLPWSEIAKATRIGGFPGYSLTVSTHSGSEYRISTCCFDAQQDKLVDLLNSLAMDRAFEKFTGGRVVRGSSEQNEDGETIVAGAIEDQRDIVDAEVIHEPASTSDVNSQLRFVEFCVPRGCHDIDGYLNQALGSETEQVLFKGYCNYVGFNQRLVRGVFMVSNRRIRLFSMESGAKIVFVETTKRLLGKLPVPFIDSLIGFFLFSIPGSLLELMRGGKLKAIERALSTSNEQLLSENCPLRNVEECTWDQLAQAANEIQIGKGVWTSLNFLQRSFGILFVPSAITKSLSLPKDIVLDGSEDIEPFLNLLQSLADTLRKHGIEYTYDDRAKRISLKLASNARSAAA